MSISFKGKKFKVKQEVVNFRYKKLEMKTLNLSKKKVDTISNLIGLEKLTDIEAIILDDNHITEIGKFPNLENLKFLSLENNAIQNIKTIEGLTNLVQLDLTGNELDKVPRLEFLPNLTVLSLSNNKITEISNLETLQNLEFLFLDNNYITEIKNLESLKRLSWLSLTNNQITEVKNLNECHALRYIFLQNNRITRIFPIHLKFLDEFGIFGNPFYTYLKSRFTNLTPQKIIEYSIDSEGLEKRLKVGETNIFVPIDYSNVRRLIPHHEDILYSTLCNVEEKHKSGSTRVKSNWKSHLIVTESGITITVPTGQGIADGIFFEWSEIWELKSKGDYGALTLIREPKTKNTLIITVDRDVDFESYESLFNRRKSFPDFCISLWEEHRPHANVILEKTYYCDSCGTELKSEELICNECGADNEQRLKKLKKLENAEKSWKSSVPLSSSMIISSAGAKRTRRAKRIKAKQAGWNQLAAKANGNIRKAKTKLIIGNTHEGKLEWIKKQYYELKRSIQEISDDLGESMIKGAKYIDEIKKQGNI